MKRKELLICDFAAEVKEKDRISPKRTKDLWEIMSYQTEKVSGNMLLAFPQTMPKPVMVSPKISGWYRIYVCIADTWGGRISLKLTDDEFDRVISMRDTHFYYNWYRAEIAEECLWKCADMTGQDVEISKIDDKQPNTANIHWLRFVPMDEDEVKAHLETRRDRTVLAHMDEDFHQYDSPKSIRDYCKCLYSMKDSDVGIVAQEVSNDIAQFGNADKVEKMSENNDDYFTVHKILSYNGQNLLYNHPNWRA